MKLVPGITIVVADGLGHQHPIFDTDRLVHHPALLRVVTHFHVAFQREILAERVSAETVIGEDAAQVGMVVEQDAEQVEGFPFKPVGAGPDRGNRGYPGRLTGDKTAHPQAPVVLQG